jgi:hypothetical protein
MPCSPNMSSLLQTSMDVNFFVTPTKFHASQLSWELYFHVCISLCFFSSSSKVWKPLKSFVFLSFYYWQLMSPLSKLAFFPFQHFRPLSFLLLLLAINAPTILCPSSHAPSLNSLWTLTLFCLSRYLF